MVLWYNNAGIVLIIWPGLILRRLFLKNARSSVLSQRNQQASSLRPGFVFDYLIRPLLVQKKMQSVWIRPCFGSMYVHGQVNVNERVTVRFPFFCSSCPRCFFYTANKIHW